MTATQLHWIDYIVFCLSLLLSIGIGIFHACKSKFLARSRSPLAQESRSHVEAYLLAGRRMSVLPVSLSIFVSWFSSNAFLGDPVEVYRHGCVYMYICLGYLLACPIIASLFAPFYNKLNITSAYQFLESRYGKLVRYMCASLQVISMIFFLGVVLYGPAVALSQVTGIHEVLAIVIIGVVGISYTTMGGLRAVVWVDSVQSVIMLAGLLCLVLLGANQNGGFTNVWNTAKQQGRINLDKIDPRLTTRSTLWSYLIGGFFRLLIPFSSDQLFIQRYSAVKSPQHAKRVVHLMMPMIAVLISLFGVTGVVMTARYAQCDPVLHGTINTHNQLVPLFMTEVFSGWPGLTGLFLAAIFAAALSTLSSALNAVAAILLTDILSPLIRYTKSRDLPEKSKVTLAKIISLVCGVVVIFMAILTLYGGGAIFTLSVVIIGVFFSPIGAMFFTGRLCTCVDSLSACIGALAGLLFNLWLSIGAILFPADDQSLSSTSQGCGQAHIAQSVSLNYTGPTLAITEAEPSGLVTIATATNNMSSQVYPLAEFHNISPLWLMPLGFTVSVVTALLCAAVTKICGLIVCNKQPVYPDDSLDEKKQETVALSNTDTTLYKTAL